MNLLQIGAKELNFNNLFSMNPICGREKSDFLFSSDVTEHPNAY